MKILIVGAGETGYYIASEFSEDNYDVTVVDENPVQLQNIQRSLNIAGVQGNCTSLAVLESAGIRDTDLLIACTDHDETNLVCCLLASRYKLKHKIALTKTDSFLRKNVISKYLQSGINQIINIPLITAQEIIATVSMASATEVSAFGKKNVILAGYRIKENSPWNGKQLKDIRIDTVQNQFLIASIVRDGRSFIPGGLDKIQVGDYVYVMTPSQYTEQLNEVMDVNIATNREAVIAGDGMIAERVAVSLLKSHYKVIMVCRNEIKKNQIQKRFSGNKNMIVKLGKSEEVRLQLRLDVATCSVFIAVNSDDLINIESCIVAQYLGANKTICQINRQDLAQSIDILDIDSVISPRLGTARRVKKLIRGGEKALHYTTISETNMEVMEMVISDKSSVLNKPLKDVKLPEGCLFGAVIKSENQVVIASGHTVIEAGDKVIMITTPESFIKLRDLIEGNRSAD